MNSYTFLKSVLIAGLLACNTAHAQQSKKSMPKVAEFDVNNLSYSFEQTLPDLEQAWIDVSPQVRNDGLAVGTLENAKVNSQSIIKFAEATAKGKFGKYDSLLIAHKKELVFESYFKKGRINLPHFQASVTKSYNALMVARAIELDYLSLSDLDKPLVAFFKDVKLKELAKGVEAITLHHALSMQSGIRITDDERTTIFDKSASQKDINMALEFMHYSDDISPGSQSFKYQGLDTFLVVEVLKTVIPGSINDFINNELLGPLGIDSYGWRKDSNGVPIPDSRSSFTSRDMMKFGLLMKNHGQWQGKQLLSKVFVVKAFGAITRATESWMPENYFYGYLWYQAELSAGDKTYAANLAWGAGGNRIIVINELDLVVVITGHDPDDKIMPHLEKVFLTAFNG